MSSFASSLTVSPADRQPTNAGPPVPLPVDEWQLVVRASGGDVGAFEHLYRLCSPRVYALCLRMTGNDVHARELAHDAFVHAWETLSMFRGESSFQSWLHRLVVNVVLQDARTTRRREARVRLVDDDETTAEVAVNSEGLDAITRMDLDEALARLAPDSRRVVVMHDIEGFRHEEIAQLLGVAAGTVRARLHHARKQLREWMTP
jgi:RNA polymerase sigma-70 factor (ECF subfamily)